MAKKQNIHSNANITKPFRENHLNREWWPTIRRPAPLKRMWHCEQTDLNCFNLIIPFVPSTKWPGQRILITSDRHTESVYCRRELMIKHMKEARAYHAPILDWGDFLDIMQGARDRRGHKSELDPAVLAADGKGYYSKAVNFAVNLHAPYADLFAVIAKGNHESAVDDHTETDVFDSLVDKLSAVGRRTIFKGHYSGCVLITFERPKGGPIEFLLHYDHGFAGGGIITADMLSHFRRIAYLPAPDVVCSAHTHDQWAREFTMVDWDRETRKQIRKQQLHIKNPSYKDEYSYPNSTAMGLGNWATSKMGMGPKPLGGWWLNFDWCDYHNTIVRTAEQAT